MGIIFYYLFTKLGIRVKGVFVKFKSLAVRRTNDTVRTFSLQHIYNIIDDNQSDWWEILFQIVSQERNKSNITDKLVDTRTADGDSSTLPEPKEPAVPEPEVVTDTIDRQDTENASGGNEEQFEDCNDGEQAPVVPTDEVSVGEAALKDAAEKAKTP